MYVYMYKLQSYMYLHNTRCIYMYIHKVYVCKVFVYVPYLGLDHLLLVLEGLEGSGDSVGALLLLTRADAVQDCLVVLELGRGHESAAHHEGNAHEAHHSHDLHACGAIVT